MRSVGVVLSIACLMPAIAGAAECDRRLQPIGRPQELAYRDRGDRCEGLYEQPVATTGLRILGFQADRVATTVGQGIEIHVEAPGSKKLTIESLRRRHYYRMDKRLEENSYYYSFELVNDPRIKLAPAEIAVRACLERCESSEPVLTPAWFATAAADGAARQPFVTLQATEDLTMMHVEVSAVNGKVLFSKDVLHNRTWPAWRPAEIPLSSFFEQSSDLVLRVTSQGRSLGQSDVVSARLLSAPR